MESWRRAWPEETLEYIAYIDAKDTATLKELVERCRAAGIRSVVVPPELHTRREILFPATPIRRTHASSFRNAISCQYAWLRETSAEHKRTGRLIFTQSDIFPFKVMKWDAWMAGGAISYRPQHRVSEDGLRRLDYAWEGLCGFDLTRWTSKMIAAMSFEAGRFRGIFGDTGAGSWLLLSALPAELKRGWLERDSGSWTPAEAALPPWLQRFLTIDPRGQGAAGPAYGELFDDWCFHLRGGSDYEKADARMLQLRFALFQAFLYEELRGSSDQTGAKTQTCHRA